MDDPRLEDTESSDLICPVCSEFCHMHERQNILFICDLENSKPVFLGNAMTDTVGSNRETAHKRIHNTLSLLI